MQKLKEHYAILSNIILYIVEKESIEKRNVTILKSQVKEKNSLNVFSVKV